MHVRTENVSIHVLRMTHVLLLLIVRLLVISLFAHVPMDTSEILEPNANYVSTTKILFSYLVMIKYILVPILLIEYKQPPLFL